MARDIIIVGIGDYYTKLVQPSLAALRERGLVGKIATVDIRDGSIQSRSHA